MHIYNYHCISFGSMIFVKCVSLTLPGRNVHIKILWQKGSQNWYFYAHRRRPNYQIGSEVQ